jgi:hypothetical protein
MKPISTAALVTDTHKELRGSFFLVQHAKKDIVRQQHDNINHRKERGERATKI